jgi:hypothetical protein
MSASVTNGKGQRNHGADRRRYPRFTLRPGYTAIGLRRLESDAFGIDGHAYDLSLGGMRFEADEAVEPGTSMAIRIDFPGADSSQSVYVFGNVIWLEDEEDGAPYKMAAVFTRFARDEDRERLADALSNGKLRAAA